ncbi:MAG: LysM peptidoglycan-binding domain-containing protein [Dermabacter sp.]|nr:LysM peptidoglycan-binding domain-containing protein [Dermabacter sp.]
MTLTHHAAPRQTQAHHPLAHTTAPAAQRGHDRAGVRSRAPQQDLPASVRTLTPGSSAARGAAWIGGGLLGAGLAWASVTAAWDAIGATRELSWSLIALLAAAFTACALHVGLMHLLAAAATLAGPSTGVGRALVMILKVLAPRLARAVIVASSTASCAIALMAPPASAVTVGAPAPVAVHAIAAHGGIAHAEDAAGPAAGASVTDDQDRDHGTGHALPALGWAADAPAPTEAPTTPTADSAPGGASSGEAASADAATGAAAAIPGAAGTTQTDTATADTDLASGHGGASSASSTKAPEGAAPTTPAAGSPASSTGGTAASEAEAGRGSGADSAPGTQQEQDRATASSGQGSAGQAQAPASPDTGAHTGATADAEPDADADADGTVMQVRPGDSLWAIARNQLPTDNPTNEQILDVLDRLIEANPQIENPDLIFPGQGIKLPSLDVPR